MCVILAGGTAAAVLCGTVHPVMVLCGTVPSVAVIGGTYHVALLCGTVPPVAVPVGRRGGGRRVVRGPDDVGSRLAVQRHITSLPFPLPA